MACRGTAFDGELSACERRACIARCIPRRAGPPRLRSRHGRLRGDTKEKSDFKLDETAVNSWAYELLNDNNLPEAIILLKLNVQNYPDSGNAHYGQPG